MGLLGSGDRGLKVLDPIKKYLLFEFARRLSNYLIFFVSKPTILMHTSNEYFTDAFEFSDFSSHLHIWRVLRSESIVTYAQPWPRGEKTLRPSNSVSTLKFLGNERRKTYLIESINHKVLGNPGLMRIGGAAVLG